MTADNGHQPGGGATPAACASVADVLAAADIIVVKVGSALLLDPDNEDTPVRGDWLAGLAHDIVALRNLGKRVLVTTSGAVALGRARLGLSASADIRLDDKQAASAAGQTALINAWDEALGRHGVCAAQVLLTLDDTENRRRYLNARQTLTRLLDLGAVPVINENDTVATAEIRYGDNDRLAAHAAQLIGADCLVILSDVDGLYTADPSTDEAARHIAVVDRITPAIDVMAGAARPGSAGTGGMATKIAAARLAAAHGCATIIAPGRARNPLAALRASKPPRATLFRTALTPASARKTWIANRLKAAGTIHIDAGACAALERGASLLPAGVTAFSGDFRRGDAVSVCGPDGRMVAQGLVGCDAGELHLLAGKRAAMREQADPSGEDSGRRQLVIDRNNLVMRDR